MRGVDRMAGLLRPTLGPLPRTVAIAHLVGGRPPETLDSGATIARRTLQLADPFENMGAMLVRHLVWQVYERVGDGTATAAVLAQALIRGGARAVAAGAGPVALQRGLQRGLATALAALHEQMRPIDGPTALAGVVAGPLGDRALAELIGEAVDAVGADGAILVEDGPGTQVDVEYLDGVRWNAGFASSFLLRPDEATTARVLNPRVLVTDAALERAEQLVPTLEACVAAGERGLFIVAPDVRDAAIGLLVANRERGVLEAAVVVSAPSFGEQRTGILEDLAALTGGRCIRQARGDRLVDVTINDLGRARQAWATRVAFGILGGRGTKAAVRQRIAEAKAELRQGEPDAYTQRILHERIGKLLGTAALVRVGAPTPAEQAERKLRVEAAVRAARAALRSGVVPGGGAALLACATAIDQVAATEAGDEALGVRALGQALGEPMRALLDNAGLEPAPIVEQVRSHHRCATPPSAATSSRPSATASSAVGAPADGSDTARANGPPRAELDPGGRSAAPVYDVVGRCWVDAWRAGLVDPLEVSVAVLEASVSLAATALGTAVLVRRKRPPLAIQP